MIYGLLENSQEDKIAAIVKFPKNISRFSTLIILATNPNGFAIVVRAFSSWSFTSATSTSSSNNLLHSGGN